MYNTNLTRNYIMSHAKEGKPWSHDAADQSIYDKAYTVQARHSPDVTVDVLRGSPSPLVGGRNVFF